MNINEPLYLHLVVDSNLSLHPDLATTMFSVHFIIQPLPSSDALPDINGVASTYSIPSRAYSLRDYMSGAPHEFINQLQSSISNITNKYSSNIDSVEPEPDSVGQGSVGQDSVGQGSVGQGSVGQGSVGHAKTIHRTPHHRNFNPSPSSSFIASVNPDYLPKNNNKIDKQWYQTNQPLNTSAWNTEKQPVIVCDNEIINTSCIDCKAEDSSHFTGLVDLVNNNHWNISTTPQTYMNNAWNTFDQHN